MVAISISRVENGYLINYIKLSLRIIILVEGGGGGGRGLLAGCQLSAFIMVFLS